MLHAAESIRGAEVRRIMARVIGRRGAPTKIRSDNGSEFICETLSGWLRRAGSEWKGLKPRALQDHRSSSKQALMGLPFEWTKNRGAAQEGMTPCGRATVDRLRMNHPNLVAAHILLLALGLFP